MRELTFDEMQCVDGGDAKGAVNAFLGGAGAGGFAGALAFGAPGAAIGALAVGTIAVGLYFL